MDEGYAHQAEDENGEPVKDAVIEIAYEGSEEVTQVKVNNSPVDVVLVIQAEAPEEQGPDIALVLLQNRAGGLGALGIFHLFVQAVPLHQHEAGMDLGA